MLKFLIILLFTLPQSNVIAKPRVKRIVNGSTAEVDAFPFAASLRRKKTEVHLCGAAIITKYFLITAGHCIKNETTNSVQVYAGSVDLCGGGKFYLINRLKVHENYYSKTLENDIGLIQLIQPIRIGSNTKNINFLPRDLYIYPGDVITSVGWGLLWQSGSGRQSMTNKLQYLERTIISNEECSRKQKATAGPGKTCFDSEDYRGTCFGDSGSPLIYKYNSVNYIVGVASWRASCGIYSDGPSGYTNISYYLPWIRTQVAKMPIFHVGFSPRNFFS